MKKTLIILLGCLSMLVITSCKQKVVVNDTRTFADKNWVRFTQETFDVNIADVDECYDIYLSAVIDTALYRQAGLPIIVSITHNDGETRQFRTDLALKNAQGQWQGEFKDGLLNYTKCIRPYFFFNSNGKYTIALSQCSHRYDLYGVVSVTLHIERAEIKMK
ncbi:MAG: hypothetical protein KBT04_05455 [Bacteroidales bacterium]|nr:hypothetical protein [Candidatus Colimorpha onthohippi]